MGDGGFDPRDVLPADPETYVGADAFDPWDPELNDDDWVPTFLSSTDLLTEAERRPVGREMVGLLYEIDVAGLDEAGHVRMAAQWQRVRNHADGQLLTAVASFAGPARDPDAPAGEPDFADCEIAAALHSSTPAAIRLIDTARTLSGRLAATLTSLVDGGIGMAHVYRVVDMTADLSDEDARRVERRVLPKAARQAPGQLQAALRRAVARIDPDGLRRKQRKAARSTDANVVSNPDGTADLIATNLPAIDGALLDTALDAWARAAKACGDKRSLARLRAAALPAWAEAYLTGRSGSSAPRQHGRPITVLVTCDLLTFLGLTNHPGEILGTGSLIPADALRDLLPGATLRRIITDPMTGHLLDYGRTTYRVPADLGGFTAAKWVTSSGPGSQVPAGRADFDHGEPWDDGGQTNRDNIHPPNRRWHRAKTIGGWQVRPNDSGGWTWVSPLGLTYDTDPHDYRLGP